MSDVIIPREVIHQLPKTDLHVHLDGSLRPATILELMKAEGLTPPAETPEGLKAALSVRDRSLTLPQYLEIFDTTLALLQRPEFIERAAFELAEDCAREHIRHLEVRYAPSLHQRKGLTLVGVMDAVLRGLSRAEREFSIHTGVIVCGIRHISPEKSRELADLAVRYKGRGVIAFDLAGAEKDYPAKDHLEAFYRILNANMNCTVHAGEAFGPASIHQAIHYCGAHRIGHGTHLGADEDLLAYVNDHRIPVEMCLTSNVHTGAVKRIEDHPFKDFYDRGLRVTLNTDNRLISGTTMTDELARACELWHLSVYELRDVIINGFKSAFVPFPKKVELVKGAVTELDEALSTHFPDTFDAARAIL